MLRNLLYSLFFHILLISLLFLSTIDFATKVVRNEATPLTISFLNENALDDIKNIKTKNEDERVKNMTLDEKINLYSKVKNLKDLENNNKVVYEKSQKQVVSPISSISGSEENEFSYYYTPVYVSEDKINTEEKRKLIENRLKREEMRKKMKEKNAIPSIDVSGMSQVKTLEEIIKISQKPLVVKKKDNKDIKPSTEIGAVGTGSVVESEVVSAQNNEVAAEQLSNSDIDNIITEISLANNAIDEKYKGINEDDIFSEDDYQKLKEINEDKVDSKYMLSLREKRNIQRQIKGCYKMAILRSGKDSKAIVGLTVNVEQDGIINMNSIKVNKIVDNFDKDSFDIALENAKSALVFCSPLRGLPIGKYRTWKQVTFVFDSNNLE